MCVCARAAFVYTGYNRVMKIDGKMQQSVLRSMPSCVCIVPFGGAVSFTATERRHGYAADGVV